MHCSSGGCDPEGLLLVEGPCPPLSLTRHNPEHGYLGRQGPPLPLGSESVLNGLL